VTVSMGMAVYPIDGDGYRDLIRASDLAMYRDKASRHCLSRPSSTVTNTG
jgi:GGDEF domain-containing protein